MSNSTLGIAWNKFEANAPHTLQKLYNDQDFADVTLATVDN